MKTIITQSLFILITFYRLIVAQSNFQLVSNYFSYVPLDVVKNGNYLYVVEMNIGLSIFDFTNPSKPILIKKLTGLDGWNKIDELIIDGNTGYVNWGDSGIAKIDFTNPANPILIGNLVSNSFKYSNIKLKFPYIYGIAKSSINDSLYLHAVDMGNGLIVSSLNLGNSFFHNAFEPKKFIINNNYLYLTMGPRGIMGPTELHIFDISVSSNISHISSVSLGESNAIPFTLQNSHWDLAKRNNYLYITARFVNQKSDIKIVDVNNPNAPQLVSRWKSPFIDNCGDIEIKNDNIFLTDLGSSFNVFTITNDTTITFCKKISGFVPDDYKINFFLKLYDNHAFIFNLDNYAVFTIDISNPCNSALIDTIALGHDWYDVSSENTQNIFSAIWNFYQFYSLDVSNLSNPQIISRTEIKGRGFGIDVKENRAYIAMGNQTYPPPVESGGLMIFNISNPSKPIKLGWNPPDTGINYDVQVYVNPLTKLAYILTGEPNSEDEFFIRNISENPGLKIVDVSNPNFPVQLSKLNINQQCRGIFQKGNYAYIAASDPDYRPRIDTSGLYIVDISNSSKPFIAGNFIRTNVIKEHSRAVVVKDNYAYLAHGDGFLVLDVSNPSSPSLVAGVQSDTTQAMDIAFENNFLFVVTQQTLYVYNISNPKTPVLLDSISDMFFKPPRRFHVQPPYIYVVNLVGIYVFKYTPLTDVIKEDDLPYRFILEQNYPNPFNQITTISYVIPSQIDRTRNLKDFSSTSSPRNDNVWVTLKIYDVIGREIATLVDEFKQPGIYNSQFSILNSSPRSTRVGAGQLPSNVYFYRLSANQYLQTKKMVYLK